MVPDMDPAIPATSTISGERSEDKEYSVRLVTVPPVGGGVVCGTAVITTFLVT